MECDADKLLLCIECRPAIYDFNMKDYANRAVVDRLWEEIAQEMNCPVSVCKAKWTSLRNSYNRAVRECHSGGKGGKRKRWYMMDSMSFLRDFAGVYRKKAIDNASDETEFNKILIDPSDMVEENSASSSPLEGVRSRKFPQTEKLADDVLTMLSKNNRTMESFQEDPTLTFFRSLVPDVNRLSESKKRKFKLEVFSMLDKELEAEEALYLQQSEQACSPEEIRIKQELRVDASDVSIVEDLSNQVLSGYSRRSSPRGD